MKNEPVLTIVTTAPPPAVSIDGKAYPLRSRDSVRNPLHAHAMADLTKLGRLLQDAAATVQPSGLEELARLLKKLTIFALPTASPAVIAKMSDDHRWAVLDAFVQSVNRTDLRPAAPKRPRRTSTRDGR